MSRQRKLYLTTVYIKCRTRRHSQAKIKFEKKALRCIFTGYDSERKGWRCVDPATGRVHVSRNVVFDEASSWWSTDHNALPDSRELELETQEKMNSDAISEPVLEEPTEKPCLEENPNQADTSLNPWRSGVHQIRNAEEARPSQLDEPENEVNANKLRRSSRTQKPNPRGRLGSCVVILMLGWQNPVEYE
ncbi:hypothetical protein MRB53_033918 [Persea americana]|uniref:Uncharacterized protein n=1 Tax=Persea americana TaxID=3435 RepID=A0ACC2KWP0_PERAE|nr:hypothetical protein MRB53_033918 [Persea americana]